LKLRTARPGDLASLQKLWRTGLEAGRRRLTAQEREARARVFIDRHMASATLLIAAVGEGRVLGCLGYDTAGRAAVIDALLVDPEHQGEGVGRSFVDWLKTRHDQIEVAIGFGARELRGFYKELDFVEAAHPGPRGEDADEDADGDTGEDTAEDTDVDFWLVWRRGAR
jgi:N-acetylglutamate synthase-like GNAT family acetyltransferase